MRARHALADGADLTTITTFSVRTLAVARRAPVRLARVAWPLRALALGVVLNACAGATTRPPDGASATGRVPRATPVVDTAPQFARRVDPFVVRGTGDVDMAQPFLGGFEVPRPQLVDIDGDGDLDLFVQEQSNALMFFENVDGTLTWRTDRWRDLPIGEWYRFVDLDGDGRVDLLSESPVSYIRAWRNEGTRAEAQFRIAVDSLADADGRPIPADRQNILNVVDIDCNGQLDLFIGRVAGTVDRFEALPRTERNGVPRFALHTEQFEGILVTGPIPGAPGNDDAGPTHEPGLAFGSQRHGANTLAFGDLDGDGDQDLLWGDYFEAGLLLMENRGTACAEPNLRGEPVGFPRAAPLRTSGYNAPTVGDLDGNGLPDVVLGVIGGAFTPRTTSVENLLFVAQTARGRFDVRTRRLIPTIDVGSESMPTLADLDGDGDLDLLIGNKIAPDTDSTATLTWFENTGTPRAPQFTERGLLPLRGEFHYAPTLADLDGDGRPDLVTGTWRDVIQWWRNVGTVATPRWELADSALITLTRGSNTAPAFADLDGDGDLDLLVGEASGQLNLYRNVGTRTAPRFELVSDTYLDLDVGRRSAPLLVDLRGDGRPDLVLGSEDGGVQHWRNVSAGESIRFERTRDLDVVTGPFSAPTAGDIDGDGDLDLLVGNAAGGLRFFENTRIAPPR